MRRVYHCMTVTETMEVRVAAKPWSHHPQQHARSWALTTESADDRRTCSYPRGIVYKRRVSQRNELFFGTPFSLRSFDSATMATMILWLATLCFAIGGIAIKPVTPQLPVLKSEQLNWAQYPPYFPRAKYKNPPSGCEVDQVRLLLYAATFPHLM